MMHVEAFESAADFLAATEGFRSRQPVLTNVIGSVASSVAAGRTYERERWLTVGDGDGTIVGCAIRTAPWPATLSPMPAEAAEAIGLYLAAHEPDLTVVTGPADVAPVAVTAMGRDGEVRMRDVVRVLGALNDASNVDGMFRSTNEDDVPLLSMWLDTFGKEAGLPVSPDEETARLAVREGRIFLWEDSDGTPVAMGGNARVVVTPGGTVGQIGPVYTPADQRRKGYGSTITHAIACRLLTACDAVMLFADAANPDSNSIYERLGFAAVAEIIELDLV